MTKQIRTVTVVGAAGTMGAGFIGQLSNAGVKVYALDRVPKDEKDKMWKKFLESGKDRSIVVKDKVETMKKVLNPMDDIMNAGFMHPSNADRIIPGNVEDDLERAIMDSDWLIEVIPDRPEWKQGLFGRIEEICERNGKTDLFVSSNTSTMPIDVLTKGRSDKFKTNLMITHGYNPLRFMHLMETVAGPLSSPEMVKTISEFCDKKLGKFVLPCKDTPFFVGNRIGAIYTMMAATHAMEQGITIDEADAMLGKPFGLGDAGVFNMVDMVGLGLVPDIAENAATMLPKNDEFHSMNYHRFVSVVNDLISKGRTGRAAGGGFYRPKRDEDGKSVKDKKGKTILQGVDLTTGEYRDPSGEKLAAAAEGKKGPDAVLKFGDKYSNYAWTVVRDIILYSLNRVPEIADSIEDIDAAVRHGYGWKQGPFELLDKIGVKYFTDRVKKDGIALPPLLEMANGRNFYTVTKNGEKMRLDFDFTGKKASYVPVQKRDGVLLLDDVKRTSKPVVTHKSASTWDIGDGVLCLEFHSPANSIDPSILYVINETIKTMTANSDKYKALVLYNDGKDFSLGANIKLIDVFVQAAKKASKYSEEVSRQIWDATYQFIDNFAYAGQPVYKALREAPFPVVGAPSGRGWGGGCEALLHCDALQTNSEMSMALPEGGVGLIPGYGGTLRLLERMQARLEHSDKGPFVPLEKTFRAIAMPHLSGSTSAQDSYYKGWLRHGVDEITMNHDRLLADAKAKALSMVDGYKPPEPAKLRLQGKLAKTAFKTAVDSFSIAGTTTWYDIVVADALGDTLAGSDDAHIGKVVTEEEYLRRENANFTSLTRLSPTMDRIRHMIAKGKPLREGPLEKPRTIDEIRAMREDIAVRQRPLTGKPLDGEEGQRLKRMADLTAAMIDINDGKYSKSALNLIRAALG